MNVLALSIAVVGLVTSVVSLTWQIVQHRLSGPVVRAGILWGGFGEGGRVVTGPITRQLAAFRHALVDEYVVAVRGRNLGRMPVDVSGFMVEAEGTLAYSLGGWRPNVSLPHRLEPGSAVTFYVPLEDIERLTLPGGKLRYNGRARGRLDHALGDTVTSDWVAFTPRNRS